MTYNGWANWATWNLNLWIENDWVLYRAKQRFLRRYGPEIFPRDVELFCRKHFPNGTPDMTPDDMNDVDWLDLAESWSIEAEEAMDYA